MDELSDAHRIYERISTGGLVLACTDTGYGLVGMGSDAVRRIYELKGRPRAKPCVTVGTLAILDDVAAGLDTATSAWLAEVTPRWPLAVVTKASGTSRLIATLEPFVVAQCMQAGTIATFHGVGTLISLVADLALADGRLVVGSSANLAGTGNNYTLESVPGSIRSAVDLEVDSGAARFAGNHRLASSILDLTRGTFLREGVCFADVETSFRAFAREHGIQRASSPL